MSTIWATCLAAAAADAEGGGGFADLFKQFSRGRGGAARAAPAARGNDLKHELTIPFATAVLGGEAALTVQRHDGNVETIKVKIPAGIDDGKKIRLRGQGEPGAGDAPAGDILLTIHVSPHPYFRRTGNRLDVRVPVTLAEAAQGAKIDVPTPHGTISLTVPPNTSSGKRLRIKGHGVQAGQPAGGRPVCRNPNRVAGESDGRRATSNWPTSRTDIRSIRGRSCDGNGRCGCMQTQSVPMQQSAARLRRDSRSAVRSRLSCWQVGRRPRARAARSRRAGVIMALLGADADRPVPDHVRHGRRPLGPPARAPSPGDSGRTSSRSAPTIAELREIAAIDSAGSEDRATRFSSDTSSKDTKVDG